MKIYFCDGCNESVPLVDVQSGRVTTIKGKLFCTNCIPPGAVAPAPLQSAPAASRSPLLAVLVLGLLTWTVWNDWDLIVGANPIDLDTTEAQGDPVSDLQRQAERTDVQVMQLSADAEQIDRALTSLRADLEALRAADADQARGAEQLANEMDRLARTQAEMGRLIEKVQLTSNRTDVLTTRLDALSDSVAAHQALLSMGTVRSGDASLSLDDSMGSMLPESGAVTQVVDPVRLAEIEDIRRQLLDAQADLRFEAVDRVENGRYEELAPDLVAMLDDEDMFVRLHAMHALETLVYEEAVPALFDVLEDEHAAIRKAAAETLVRLTGFDPGYEHKGSSGERAKAVREWREWYDER